MIKSFRTKGLKDFWETGSTAGIRQDLAKRARRRLDALDAATNLKQLNQPGFDFHPLSTNPVRHSMHVNGPWCITFEWDGSDAWRVDLEQYH